ncbi:MULTISPECIES: AzlD domain-containing protein [unclassified Rhizobacter]|uniref:AzlD domain-containing protein n=1 Tax=unclassified Rhizobacter TaxID=2640088 RepID=UPI0006FE3209|nr:MULTISPECIES: AzlD domain-containing protein [unclassified Rhizobacter]KQU67819.1 branched-chain amino acid transporter [Rhizobacter sp. Root29]KQW15294.1 branched-chain amino acid transporter [Rhizobacter sp. Root1238]KRB24458.1 branched-chain amino acid transporter [Rhizobacter sp. Root16D2]
MSELESLITIIGLTAITVLTRCFFLVSDRELRLPGWVQRGLRYAPLAALAAVVVPEVAMSQGQLIATWQDARLWSVLAATVYFFWRRGILGTILVGMAVLVPLKLLAGW